MSHEHKCSEVLTKDLQKNQCYSRILHNLTRMSWADQNRDCKRYQRRFNANLFLDKAQDLYDAAESSE